MNKVIFCFLIYFLHGSIIGQSWTSNTTNTTANFYDVEFTPDSIGWAVTFAPPRVYKSTDYGKTWTINYSPSITVLKSITFLNDSVGFIAGGTSGGSLTGFKTTDGGQTWTSTSFSANNFWLPSVNKIAFSSIDTGYVFGHNGTLFYHEILRNGGSRWRPVSPGPTMAHIWSGHVFGLNDLLVASNVLFRKTSASSSWKTVFARETHDIDFINDTVGYALTDTFIIKTIDKGANWDTLSTNPLPSNSIGTIEALDTNEIYIGGYDNKIYRSIDGGISWKLDNSQTRNRFITNIESFGTDIWACGSSGQLLKRTPAIVNVDDYYSRDYSFNIYPNPAENFLNVDFSNFQENPFLVLRIISMNGKLVYSKRGHANNLEQIINIENYKSGIYFVICDTEEGSYRKKVIIQ